VAIIAVSTRIYLFWQEGLGDLPTVVRRDPPAALSETKPPMPPPPLATTEIVISKNLFDPERGAVKPKIAEEDTRAMQRVKGLVLLGTAILGANQFAIVQETNTSSNPTTPGRPAGALRFKLGDVFEGFRLSEVHDKNVVFRKGASKVELALDYFRKVETPVLARGPVVQPSLAGAASVPPSGFARNSPAAESPAATSPPRTCARAPDVLAVNAGPSLISKLIRYFVCSCW
jgi:hypothetical protein